MKKITAIVASLLLANFSFAGGFSDHSGTSLKRTGNASVTLVKGTSAFSGAAATDLYHAMEAGVIGMGNFSVAAAAKSGEVTTIVIEGTSEMAGKVYEKSGSQTVVTATGDFISGTLTSTYTHLKVSVTKTGEVIAHGSDHVVGAVKWSGGKVKAAGSYLVDASGKIYVATGSKKVVGTVVDSTGKVVKFTVTSTKEFYTVSTEQTSLVITTSGALVKQGATLVGEGVVAVVRATGDVILTLGSTAVASGKHSARGEFLKASEILVYLPANILKSAVYSEMHYKTIK